MNDAKKLIKDTLPFTWKFDLSFNGYTTDQKNEVINNTVADDK